MEDLFVYGSNAKDKVYNGIRDSLNSYDILCKAKCLDLWKIYHPYSDKNFLSEIQNDFHSRYWEMYLTVSLIELGYNVASPKPGPDVKIKFEDLNIWIEAVAPDNGEIDKPDSVEIRNNSFDVPSEKIILRYLNSIKNKLDQYKSHLQSKIINPNDPFIIAISSSKLNFRSIYFDNSYLLETLFPIGKLEVTLNIESGEVIHEKNNYRDIIPKSGNRQINSGIFFRKEFKNLSGILFCSSNVSNFPETKYSDFTFIHNPYSNNLIPSDFIKFGVEYNVSIDGDKYRFDIKNHGSEKIT